MASLAINWLRRGQKYDEPFAEGPQSIGPGGIPDMTNMRGKLYQVRGWNRWSDRKKVRKLRGMAEAYGNDPRMRFFTVNSVLRPAGATNFRDYARVAQALLSAVQDAGSMGIMYTNEPNEQLQSPWWTLKVRTGDCDDLAILLASMAQSVRLPWRFVLGGKCKTGRARWAEGDRRMPRGFKASHIYLDLGWPPFSEKRRHPNGRPMTTWAAAEPTLRGVPLGYDVMIQGVPGGAQRLDLSGPDSYAGIIYSRQLAGLGDADLDADLETLSASDDQGTILERMQDAPLVGYVARAISSLDASVIIAEAIGSIIQAVILAWAVRKLKLD